MPQEIVNTMFVSLYERVKYLQNPTLKFNNTEKQLLQLAFNNFVGGDNAGRGFEMFCQMFKNRPETQKLFDFARGNSAAQMQNSSRMLFHVTRVVKALVKVLNSLDRPEDVAPLLRIIGGRHVAYGVAGNYFPYLGEATRQLMAAQVKGWTAKHDQLWNTLWDWIVAQLVDGMSKYGNSV